jgi:hypothetical protein
MGDALSVRDAGREGIEARGAGADEAFLPVPVRVELPILVPEPRVMSRRSRAVLALRISESSVRPRTSAMRPRHSPSRARRLLRATSSISMVLRSGTNFALSNMGLLSMAASSLAASLVPLKCPSPMRELPYSRTPLELPSRFAYHQRCARSRAG